LQAFRQALPLAKHDPLNNASDLLRNFLIVLIQLDFSILDVFARILNVFKHFRPFNSVAVVARRYEISFYISFIRDKVIYNTIMPVL